MALVRDWRNTRSCGLLVFQQWGANDVAGLSKRIVPDGIDRNNATDVVAFADLGTRSIMLRSKIDSQVYETLAQNAFVRHGDTRLPRIDVVGKMRYCAPIAKDQTDWLNLVAVLDLETVRFYLVSPDLP